MWEYTASLGATFVNTLPGFFRCSVRFPHPCSLLKRQRVADLAICFRVEDLMHQAGPSPGQTSPDFPTVACPLDSTTEWPLMTRCGSPGPVFLTRSVVRRETPSLLRRCFHTRCLRLCLSGLAQPLVPPIAHPRRAAHAHRRRRPLQDVLSCRSVPAGPQICNGTCRPIIQPVSQRFWQS